MNHIASHVQTDEQLLQRTLTGKEHFAQLIDRYEAPLRRYVRRLGIASPDDATDLLQNIFIKVYQNINAFDPSLKFSSWLYRIAHNEVISHIRKMQARPEGHAADFSDDDFEALVSDLDTAHESERQHMSTRLQSIVQKLDEKYRSVIVLHYFEYKGYEEIADILCMPPGTVAVRLRRAKEKIRNELLSNGYIHD